MFNLPPPLAALGLRRQFFPCLIIPDPSRPGKTNKFPIDYRTGAVANAHDSAIWLSVTDAAMYAEAFGPQHTVGFVFTRDDPFFFIDIDDCLENGDWSATAKALMQRFAGAAVEISHSGSGLHIIGTGDAGPPPPARKVKYAQWFDLYTENRFVALTGTSAVGDVATVHSLALHALVSEYLTPDSTIDSDWTDAPCENWRGPTDDQDLIRRALQSKSARGALGHAATFADLWMADESKLVQFFPDPARDSGYDASSADSSLAQALAFWTGRDCERIQRLMWMSDLKREKWDREDYLRRTILGVVRRQGTVCEDKPPEPARVSLPPGVGASAEGQRVTGSTFLDTDAQMNHFRGCVYVWSRHYVLIPGGHVLKPDQFRAMYGGYTFAMDDIGERTSRNAWEAFIETQSWRAPRADGLTFRPELPPAALINDAGSTLVNVWWPITTPSTPGDPTPFLNHLAKLLPNEADRLQLISYMAAITQYPGVKFQWAPLIQGVEGNGKTFLSTAIAQAVGDRYSHTPNSQDLTNKFTGWLEKKLFINVEEIYSADRREIIDALKPLITNKRVEIQAKGQDQFTGDNRANFFLLTNHKDAIPKTLNDRRYAIYFTAQQNPEDLRRDGLDGQYMPKLYAWAEAGGWATINHYLRSFAIPDALNPATEMHRAPETSSTREAINISVGAIEQEIVEAIESDTPGFAGGWVSSMALDKLLQRIKAERRVPPRKRKEMMEGLGYVWHPGLENTQGRCTMPVNPDGGKPRLYAKVGHIINNITQPKAVMSAYENAQTKSATEKANFGVDGTGNKP